MKNGKIELFFGVLAAFCAGIVNGMLGTGGGIILVFWLARIMNEERGFNPKDVFATVIAIILPMSVVSLIVYLKGGSIDFKEAFAYLPSGAIGGILGAMLLEKINVKVLKKVFALMVVYAGVKMLF